ncbi:hypothetical protein TNCV_96971 [Trichonephila clavipes]|nr:hypothetical protein TNCV_96971 [Trichonephila clavipes]
MVLSKHQVVNGRPLHGYCMLQTQRSGGDLTIQESTPCQSEEFEPRWISRASTHLHGSSSAAPGHELMTRSPRVRGHDLLAPEAKGRGLNNISFYRTSDQQYEYMVFESLNCYMKLWYFSVVPRNKRAF